MKLAVVVSMLALAGCGMAETGTAAATAAALQAKEAEQAKDVQTKIRGQLEQAGAQASPKREEAESAAR